LGIPGRCKVILDIDCYIFLNGNYIIPFIHHLSYIYSYIMADKKQHQTEAIRKLAAIMFTDIQGYTSMMQQDESTAIKFREKHRLIFNKSTKKFNGKILQYFGDGTLSIFDSAIEAVKCGIEMQLAFQEEPKIPVRIGIHIGDIIFSIEEIIGDGVNIASRIESLAVPGSVFISDKVYDEIKNQSSIYAQSLKSFNLKNVDKPVEIYAISNKGLIVPDIHEYDKIIAEKESGQQKKIKAPKALSQKKQIILYGSIIIVLILIILWKSNLITGDSKDIKSIAVLPLKNITGDTDQEFFSDGMTEALIAELSQISALRVISRTSVLQYKNTKKTIPEIARDLNVDAILEGSVVHSGERVRIVAQLIGASPERHIWAESYDRDLTDVLTLFSDVAQAVADEIKIAVTPEEQKRMQNTRKINPEAVEFFLKGQYHANINKTEYGLNKALDYLYEAINIDSTYALAYSMLAYTYVEMGNFGILSSLETYPKAIEAAEKALELDDQIAEAYAILGMAEMTFNWDWIKAERSLKKGLELNQNSSLIMEWNADYLLAKGRIEEAVTLINRSIDRDPFSVAPMFHLSEVYWRIGQYDQALELTEKILEINPGYSLALVIQGAVYMEKGMYKEAVATLSKANVSQDSNVWANCILGLTYSRSGETDKALNVLNELKIVTEKYPVFEFWMAVIYADLNDKDQALSWLEKAFENRNTWLARIKSLSYFDNLESDPRYKEIINRIGLSDL